VISRFLSGFHIGGSPPRKSRFTVPQIVTNLEEGDAAVPVAQRARPHGISAATHYTTRLAQ